jgi:hypothetical protein
VCQIIRSLQKQLRMNRKTSKDLTMNTLSLDTFRNSLARMRPQPAVVSRPAPAAALQARLSLAPQLTAMAALALVMAAGGAVAEPAQPVGWHPAMAAQPVVAGIDPNTFIVGHPASPTVRGGHANFEHPAVIVARRAVGIDANTFIVQPPVAVSWTVQPEREDDTRLAALRP